MEETINDKASKRIRLRLTNGRNDKRQGVKADTLTIRPTISGWKGLKVSQQEGAVELFDPQTGNSVDSCSLENFLSAWGDSQNFLVVANRQGDFVYDPQPISVADVELNPELLELGEAIAENAHEIWASKRRAEGWQYGMERNDEKLETPNMVPYSDLPEIERQYDREMAFQTLKLVKKLGYRIEKEEE